MSHSASAVAGHPVVSLGNTTERPTLNGSVAATGDRGQEQDVAFKVSLVRLVSWPALIDQPEGMQPAIARLCALLARKPTTVSLLPRLLGLPEAQVFPLIDELGRQGHLQLAGRNQLSSPDGAATDAAADDVPAHDCRGGSSSLIGKIWQRLSHPR